MLSGEAEVTAEDGGTLDILSGHAAVSMLPEGTGYSLKLQKKEGAPVYQLVFPEAGTFPVRLAVSAGVVDRGVWRTLDFRLLAGAVVPVTLNGLENEVRFDAKAPVFPTRDSDGWTGFLPADDPALVILVVIHKPQTSPWGGQVAAPVFAHIAQQLVVVFDIPPDEIRLNHTASQEIATADH